MSVSLEKLSLCQEFNLSLSMNKMLVGILFHLTYERLFDKPILEYFTQRMENIEVLKSKIVF